MTIQEMIKKHFQFGNIFKGMDGEPTENSTEYLQWSSFLLTIKVVVFSARHQSRKASGSVSDMFYIWGRDETHLDHSSQSCFVSEIIRIEMAVHWAKLNANDVHHQNCVLSGFMGY